MNPGATTIPRASMVRFAETASSFPIAAILPPRIPMSPEYHGDPLNAEGCLCFQHFGWEMLQQVKQAGFARVWALLYHSRDYGYLGNEQIQFLVEK